MTKTTTTCQCAECGATFEAKRDHAAFCSDGCRKAFNNRRMTRGAELYDLFMAVRYERGLAKLLGLWTVICRAAELWRDEDRGERDGRKSWGAPEAIIARKPYLKSKTLQKGRK